MLMDEELAKLANQDQDEESIARMARSIATFYQELRKADLPEDLCKNLTLITHQAWIEVGLGDDGE